MNIKEKAANHDRTILHHVPVVFCVNCGSTRIDQNSATTLVCYDCSNEVAWDSTKFGIRRGVGSESAGDVVESFMDSLDYEPPFNQGPSGSQG